MAPVVVFQPFVLDYSWDDSVHKVTDYGLGDWFSFPGGGIDFSLSTDVQTGSEVGRVSYSVL